MGPITESCRLRGLGKFEMCSVSGKGYSLYQNCYYCRYQALLTWRSRQDQKRKVPHTSITLLVEMVTRCFVWSMLGK